MNVSNIIEALLERTMIHTRLTHALIIALILALCVRSQPTPTHAAPHQQGAQAPVIASYKMDVQLDPVAKTVSGTEHITYTNPSKDTLNELYLRLYLRAFRDLNTTWMRESGGVSRGFPIKPDELGDITVHTLTLADGTDLLATTTLSDTLMRVPLPRPLAAGQQIELDVSWTSKLPRAFARTGYGGKNDTFFMVGQWYPKLAVYDRGQWDTEPWHANAEFFNDFGAYDVTISVPSGYVVAGVGMPTNPPQERDGRSVSHYTADDVTDFAFAASPDFQTRSARAGNVEIILYYLPEHAASVQEYLDAGVGTITTLSRWFGQYPHPRLTIIDVPNDAEGAGGMEYPTLITGGTGGLPDGSGFVAYVTAHEIGHQWWPMQTATNEATEPWLDEGLTEYSGARYNADAGDTLGFGPFAIGPATFERLNYMSAPLGKPLNQPSWNYSSGGYGALIYAKTALGLWTLERTVGTERFHKAMAEYLTVYRFKHPRAADFRATLERSLGPQPWFFDEYVTGGEIDYAIGDLNPNGDRVTIIRKGSVRVPVDLRLTLASGAVTTSVWDGQNETTSMPAPNGQRIVRVEIDPERKLQAERIISDNGVSVEPLLGPAAQLGGRLMFVFQSIAQLIGLFG